jgi:hypothetical protein
MNSTLFIDRVKSVLKDNSGYRFHPHQLQGTALDTPHLALADAGERRIFTQPEKRLFKDYHVHLLVDVSGSMQGIRCETAAIATHALEYTLSTAGATMSASMFNANYQPLPTSTIKDVDKLYKTMRTACGSGDNDCTHTAYAIDRALAELVKATPNPSRIILVLTDGGAGCSSSCKRSGNCNEPRYKYEHKANKRSVLQARERSIVLAIGIEDEGRAEEVYGKHSGISLEHVNQLYPTALKLLSSAVRRG